MRTDISPEFMAHLKSRETTIAWCWLIELENGTVRGYTNHDKDIPFGGTVYKASSGFIGSELESEIGLSTDNMELYGGIDDVDITEEDILAGLYDNAQITLTAVNWREPSERLLMKKGNIGEVKRGKVIFEAEFIGIANELQTVRGKLFNPTCDALLYDKRCGVDPSGSGAHAYMAVATVVANNDESIFILGQVDNFPHEWFSHGTVEFIDGKNAGVIREIKTHSVVDQVVSVALWERPPFVIDINDTLTIKAGCDKRFATCKAKFSNYKNFRGFPHIPGTNRLASYASAGDGHSQQYDGGGNYLGKD